MQNNSKKIKTLNNKYGFSLIEMLVAVALFTIVMLIGAGSLLSLVDANRKAQALNSVINNLNFALESMSRNLRVGTNYNCDGIVDCPSGGTSLSFTSSEGENMVYRYDSSAKLIERSKDGGTYITITAPEVTIDEFAFVVEGASPTDNLQPKIIIKIRGTAGVKKKVKTNFNLQTTVSQRILDQ